MKKYIQFSLFVFFSILSFSYSNAQSERVKFGVVERNTNKSKVETKQNLPVTTVKKNPSTGSSADENKIDINSPSSQKTTVESPRVTIVKSIVTSNEVEDARQQQAKIDAEKKYQRQQNSTDDQPIFPDLQVTATKEQSYDNNFVLKENRSEQLVKLERVPADDIQLVNTNSNNNKATISPLKRKYFEGIVADLEKEINSGNYTTDEIEAKKKERDDFKKLLTQ